MGVLVLTAVPSYYFFDKYKTSQELLKNPTEAARVEVQALVQQVGKFIELPNEEPTVATVSDKEKLADQPFFVKAENGDKVLIYTQARKAILYRPAANKIIEVSTVNLGQQEGQTAGTKTQRSRIVLLNGTNVTGLTRKVEPEVTRVLPDAEITDRDNAKKRDYQKTLVVDLSGNNQNGAGQLAKELNAQVTSLPEGESKPEAELLIILGADYAQ